MYRSHTYLLLGLISVALVACDSYEQDEFVPEVVVESYLVAGEPLPEVRVSVTAPISSRYTFENFGVEGANVIVNLLGEEGGVEESYSFVEESRGVYLPAEESAVVQPLRRYALEVRVPGGNDVVRSQTLVPGHFEMSTVSGDTIVYQSAVQLEARITNSIYPGRKSYYLFTIEAEDTLNYGLTPFYADIIDEDDGMSKSDLVRNSSGITNENDFTRHGDGTLSLKLPWIGIAFYGPNTIIANAIDDNLYDFKRSQMGGSSSPGEMDNLLDHVENGRGVFGSMVRDQLTVFIAEPEE